MVSSWTSPAPGARARVAPGCSAAALVLTLIAVATLSANAGVAPATTTATTDLRMLDGLIRSPTIAGYREAIMPATTSGMRVDHRERRRIGHGHDGRIADQRAAMAVAGLGELRGDVLAEQRDVGRAGAVRDCQGPAGVAGRRCEGER